MFYKARKTWLNFASFIRNRSILQQQKWEAMFFFVAEDWKTLNDPYIYNGCIREKSSEYVQNNYSNLNDELHYEKNY